jgi:hypothetical protein
VHLGIFRENLDRARRETGHMDKRGSR